MSKITAYVAVAMIGALMVGLLAAPVNAVSITANAPTWNEGDSWAMGKEVNLGKNITDNYAELKTAILALTNLTVDDLTVDSKASVYVLFSVLSEDATTYTIQAKMAVKFATQADISITGNMPVAGTYDMDEQLWSPVSTVPKQMKTATVDITEKMGVSITAILNVNKTSLAINQMDWKALAALSFDGKATNIPEVSSDDGTQTLAYKNYDLGMDFVARINLTAEFEPGLDIFQFPFSAEDVWYTGISMVTVTGDVSGSLDIRGLTAEQKDGIFSEELKNATGATDFPIVFDNLNSPDGEVTDGHFGPIYGNTTSTRMECVDSYTLLFGDSELDVFEIAVGSSDNRIMYTPGFRLVGMALDPANLPSGMDTVMGMIGQDGTMEMEPVATAKASAEISAIDTYTNNIADQASNPSGNPIGDFFLKAPFLGVILIIVAVVIVGAVFVLSKKKRAP